MKSFTALPFLKSADRMDSVESLPITPLLERIGRSRLVLLGEATHGTSDFYRARTRITQALIEKEGFTAVALEADWPDAAYLDAYVRILDRDCVQWASFARFPTWMWRNREMMSFVHWLREWNAPLDPVERVGIYGLDLYSLHASMAEVLRYLGRVDPELAAVAKNRYGCLEPWAKEPQAYGWAALGDRIRTCQSEVTAILRDLLQHRLDYIGRDGEYFFDAARNARLVAAAEEYYRSLYLGSAASWNLRDRHMFDTLQAVLAHKGEGTRVAVWEHNSHVGAAGATDFAERGETSVGQLCRDQYGREAYLVGFGTDHGTVAAAHEWDAPVEIMEVRPAIPDSYEGLFHESGVPGFLLGLRDAHRNVREPLSEPRLERAIGVIYRPDTELDSHYFKAVLPEQFDEYIWIDETRAVEPLDTTVVPGPDETFPSGL